MPDGSKDKDTIPNLVQRCYQGESFAQKKIYEKYFGLLMGICLRYSKEREEAKDILQEGFIKIFSNIKKFEDSKSLENWMKTVVINTAIDRYRKKISEPYQVTMEEADEPSIAAEVYEELDQQALLNAMQQLPEGYRAIFNLYVIEGFSHKEIAEKVGINEGTSKSQLAKARNMLKEKLSEYFPTDKIEGKEKTK